MASIPPKKISIRPVPPVDERDRVVLRWAAVIDQIDYLTMLRLPRPKPGEKGPTEADVRRAYRVFARAFHPDHYRTSPQDARDAAAKVFSAGAEANEVLSDPRMRLRYLRRLERGDVRVPLEELARVTDDEKRAAATPAARLTQVGAARAHGERADKMIALGELAYAKAALEDALKHDPGNPGLAAKLAAVEEHLYARRGGAR